MSNQPPGRYPGPPRRDRPLPDPSHQPYQRGASNDGRPGAEPAREGPGGPAPIPGGGGYRPPGYRPSEPSGRHGADSGPPTLRPSAPVQRPYPSQPALQPPAPQQPAPRPPAPQPPVSQRPEPEFDDAGPDDTASRPVTPPMVTGRLRTTDAQPEKKQSGPPSGRVREVDTSGVRHPRVAPPTAASATAPHQLLAPESGGAIAFGLFSGVGFGLLCLLYTAVVLTAPEASLSHWFRAAGGKDSATSIEQLYAVSMLMLVVVGLLVIGASILAFRRARSLAFVKGLFVLAGVVFAASVTWCLLDAGAKVTAGSGGDWRGSWIVSGLLTAVGLVTLAASFAGGAYIRARRDFQARGRTRSRRHRPD